MLRENAVVLEPELVLFIINGRGQEQGEEQTEDGT